MDKVGQSRLDDGNEGYNEGLGSASAYDTQPIVIKRKMKIENYWNYIISLCLVEQKRLLTTFVLVHVADPCLGLRVRYSCRCHFWNTGLQLRGVGKT